MVNSILGKLGMLLLRAAEEEGSGGGIDTSWLRHGDAGPIQPLIDLVQNTTYGIWQLVLTIGISVALISFCITVICLIVPGRSNSSDDHKRKIVAIIAGVIFLISSAGAITALVNIGNSVDKTLENSNYGESSMLLDEPDAGLLYVNRLCGGDLLG